MREINSMIAKDFELCEPAHSQRFIRKNVQLLFNNERELVEKLKKLYGIYRLKSTYYKFKTPGLDAELRLCKDFNSLDISSFSFVE